jgi:O-antigen/teichoic acid export membrane protein
VSNSVGQNARTWRNWYATLEEERILTQNAIVGAGTIIAGLLGVAFQILVSHRLPPSAFGDVFTVLTVLTLIGLPPVPLVC